MSQLKQVQNESLADCLLSQAKAPVGGKLSVAGNQERIQDAPVQTNNKLLLSRHNTKESNCFYFDQRSCLRGYRHLSHQAQSS